MKYLTRKCIFMLTEQILTLTLLHQDSVEFLKTCAALITKF